MWSQAVRCEDGGAATGAPTHCCPRSGLLGGATHLELVRLSCSDQLRDEEVCVEKVHILIQEAVQDEQAVGPGRQGGREGLGRDPLLPPIGSRTTVHAQPGLGAQGPVPAPGQRGRKQQLISRTWQNSNPVHSAQLAGLGDPSLPSRRGGEGWAQRLCLECPELGEASGAVLPTGTLR